MEKGVSKCFADKQAKQGSSLEGYPSAYGNWAWQSNAMYSNASIPDGRNNKSKTHLSPWIGKLLLRQERRAELFAEKVRRQTTQTLDNDLRAMQALK
ncbi:MAG: hypothetical protein WDM89_22285 [Rhizomicrobium sp.]